MVSPSRITTRSTPRTSRALEAIPSRRAAPTSASAASGPGQVTSSADERPGSVSEPCARKAPRQAASASHVAPDTTCGGNPRTGRPRPSRSPVWRARDSPSRTTRTTYRLARRRPPGASTTMSLVWPNTSAMSRRNRRAAPPCRARPRRRSAHPRCAGRPRTAAWPRPRPCGSRAWSRGGGSARPSPTPSEPCGSSCHRHTRSVHRSGDCRAIRRSGHRSNGHARDAPGGDGVSSAGHAHRLIEGRLRAW